MFVAICEDETFFVDEMTHFINDWQKENGYQDVYVRSYHSAESFLWNVDSFAEIDICFIDIGLPGKNGFELAETIRKENDEMVLVFFSASNGYLEKGYELGLYRYLLKPVKYEKVKNCLDHAYQRKKDKGRSLLVTTSEGNRIIPIKNVVYFTYESHSIIACYENQMKYRVKYQGNFEDFYQRLCHQSFVRWHKGYIVNMMYIDSFSFSEIHLCNGHFSIPIGRKFHNDTIQSILSFIEF